jgi:hypothetical protein
MYISLTPSTLVVVFFMMPTAPTIPISQQHLDQSQILSAEIRPEFTEISQLRSEYDFALKDGWDGEQAVAISTQCLSDIQRLLDNLPAALHWPEATPLIRGGLSLLWQDDDIYIYLEIRNDGAAHLYYNVRGKRWEGVRPADDKVLRSRLRKAVSSLPPHSVLSYVSGNAQGAPISILT